MADTSGQQDIRSVDIDRTAKGFADEEIIFKNYCLVAPTTARELRWFQKTAGFLDSTDTSGITSSQIANTAAKARPIVIGQTWTRNTSYVRKYMAESELISQEDLKDNDVNLLTTTIRDITRGVSHQVDVRIWNVMTESQSVTNINSVTTTSVGGDQWDAGSGQDIVKDLNRAIRLIRANSYNTAGAVLFVSPTDYESIKTWLISTKGSSIPNFSSQAVRDGVVMELLGLRVVESTAVTADYAAVVVPQRACTWRTFMPITAVSIDEPGIGTKIRVWEEGEALLTDPKAVTLIIDTQT